MAGSLRGAPVELVKCELSDLLVPASAEIVLEGFISPDPDTFTLEGPFSEYPGYYGGSKSPKHTIRVECITHRNDPIFHGCLTGASPGRTNEGTTWTPATFSAMAWHYLEQAGVPNITGVWRGKWPETMRVQIRKSHRGHAQQVADRAVGLPSGKLRREARDRRRRRYRYPRLGSDRVGALLSGQRRPRRYFFFLRH